MKGRRYPLGIQTFKNIIEGNYVYVDKTDLIYELVHEKKYCFLSRPRRFGKSLLVTTLQAYFEGKKELFKGLKLEALEKDWEKHPVIHLDLSKGKYYRMESLIETLDKILETYEDLYQITSVSTEAFNVRLIRIINAAKQKTDRNVVVLIDEYDAPMHDSMKDKDLQDKIRDIMRNFFSPLKSEEDNLHFVFLTGISKFSQLSIFSELNNLQNISMRDDFSALCGITEEELLTQLKPDIERMAEANDETYEEACLHLKRQYDGYHFSKACADIYNPFSLFNAFNSKEYKNYWFSTGTPTFLIDILRHADFDVRALEGVEATDEQFDAPTEQITSPIPVLYQSGYLTIKGYDRNFQIYRLAYPNGEVRKGFIESLLPSYVHLPAQNNTFYVVSFLRDLMKGDVESCLERTRSFFASIPNDLENKTEKHYQTIFYLLFRLMGQYVESEVKSSVGRADVVVQLQDVVYVFEFKYDGTPEEALAQIDSKQYAIPYRADGRRVVKIGVIFDSSTRTIGWWKIAKAD